MEISNKVALVTGATRGIGRAVARELARRGANLVIHGRDPLAAAAVRAEILALGRRCEIVLADAADPACATRCVSAALDPLGGLDILVPCAGAPAPGVLLDVSPEDWYRAFDVHVHAVFHLCRAAAPAMLARGAGAIVLVSSAAGARGCLGALAYGVAKGALPQFARSLARELAASHIRVNCVAPGIIRTAFQDSLSPEQARHNIEHRIPLHREGRPEDVADVVAMLVENDFITGETVAIDGGMTMRIA